MAITPTNLEPVPLSEVAGVLTETVRRATGGPMFVAMAHGRDLATALEHAGFVVVRHPYVALPLTLSHHRCAHDRHQSRLVEISGSGGERLLRQSGVVGILIPGRRFTSERLAR